MGFLDRIFGRRKAPEPSAPQPSPMPNVPPAPTSDADWEDLRGVPHDVGPAELAAALAAGEAPVLVDVREQYERDTYGYIPESLHIPMGELEERAAELDKSKPVVLYCASGMRSMDAGTWLLEHGFRYVSNLAGGMGAWQGPRERPAPPPSSDGE